MRKKKGARTRETSRIKNHHLHFPIVISCYTSFFLSFCVESTRKKTLRQPVRPPWIQKRVFSAKPGWPGYASASAGRGVPKWISTRASLSLSLSLSLQTLAVMKDGNQTCWIDNDINILFGRLAIGDRLATTHFAACEWPSASRGSLYIFGKITKDVEARTVLKLLPLLKETRQ